MVPSAAWTTLQFTADSTQAAKAKSASIDLTISASSTDTCTSESAEGAPRVNLVDVAGRGLTLAPALKADDGSSV